MYNFVTALTKKTTLISNTLFSKSSSETSEKKEKEGREMETLGKDITPINDDIQETSIA